MQDPEYLKDITLTEILTGKGHKDENFPVASVLLPKKLRPFVLKYYRFARTADDIADSHKISAEQKIVMLEKMRAIASGESDDVGEFDMAVDVRESLAEVNVSIYHATDLLIAFTRDSEGRDYRSWNDLIDYCDYSAAPVGRFLLELHGEDRTTFKASDAVCAALQINNHIQDAKEDYLKIERSYVPLNFMKDEGINYDELKKHRSSEAMRNVFDRMLDGVDKLLKDGGVLPSKIKHIGFRIEASIIIELAKRLTKRLRKEDPIEDDVMLRPIDWKIGFVLGLFKAIFPRKNKY
ncbi:MAG: squalene/phytoene synthase family protein [Alphaproteobacteria bacterium]|nr:squalene/phytoene synthase family protein [Alphaproteobacteria bacterium]